MDKGNYSDGNNKSNKHLSELLISLLEDSTIEPSEVLDTIEAMNKKRFIKNKYQDKIKHRKDDERYYIYINCRQVVAKRELNAKMFNNIKSIINGIFSYAISELEIVSFNPIKGMDMRQFPMKPTSNNDDDVFSVDERKLLLSHLEDEEDAYALAIRFDFNVTMRFAELSALRKEDYKNGKILIRSQG